MQPEAGHIATVNIITKVGDIYQFPAMNLESLRRVVPKNGPSTSDSISQLALVNVNLCVLSIPFNIIRRIAVQRDGHEEEWWSCAPA